MDLSQGRRLLIGLGVMLAAGHSGVGPGARPQGDRELGQGHRHLEDDRRPCRSSSTRCSGGAAAIHDNAFKALRDLQADYVRYVPWLPYPRLGVAELEPPQDGKTSWDFSVIDPMTIDFLEATKGHSVVLNFSTIPQWMVKTEKPVSYPCRPEPGRLGLHAGDRASAIRPSRRSRTTTRGSWPGTPREDSPTSSASATSRGTTTRSRTGKS